MPPRILITGANGQLGWELRRSLSDLGSISAFGRRELDLSSEKSIRDVVRLTHPDLIINAAAYTAVDRAESEPELAHSVNAEAPRILAEEAQQVGAAFIHYSTDYVFDGTSAEPYTEDSFPKPLSCYGRSKLLGDRAVESVGGGYLIFRTSWVYSTRGKNFLLTMLRLAKERNEIRLVDDQVGAPTWSRDIASGTRQVVEIALNDGDSNGLVRYFNERRGIYNMTAAGEISWFGFAKAIFSRTGDDQKLRLLPIPTSEYATPAVRPRWSVLSCEKLERVLGVKLPEWRASLTRVLDIIISEKESSFQVGARTG